MPSLTDNSNSTRLLCFPGSKKENIMEYTCSGCVVCRARQKALPKLQVLHPRNERIQNSKHSKILSTTLQATRNWTRWFHQVGSTGSHKCLDTEKQVRTNQPTSQPHGSITKTLQNFFPSSRRSAASSKGANKISAIHISNPHKSIHSKNYSTNSQVSHTEKQTHARISTNNPRGEHAEHGAHLKTWTEGKSRQISAKETKANNQAIPTLKSKSARSNANIVPKPMPHTQWIHLYGDPQRMLRTAPKWNSREQATQETIGKTWILRITPHIRPMETCQQISPLHLGHEWLRNKICGVRV